MTVLWTFRRPFMGRPVPRQLLRNELLDLTTIVPATAYHRRSYAERYSRSIEIRDETRDLTGGTVCFPFFGSPVLSVMQGATLLLTPRLEHFHPLGPPYAGLDATCQVYETPHGVLAGPVNVKKVRLLTRQTSQDI